MGSEHTSLLDVARWGVQLTLLFVCRALVAFYFLWAAGWNIRNYSANKEQMRGVGVP